MGTGPIGFAFEGRGRVEHVEVYAGKGDKEIVTLILGTDGKYPQHVPVKCFGRLGQQVKGARKGDLVHVDGHLGGREWNGKFYGDIVAETVSLDEQEVPEARDDVPPPDNEEIPF